MFAACRMLSWLYLGLCSVLSICFLCSYTSKCFDKETEPKGIIIWNLSDIDKLKRNKEAKQSYLENATTELSSPNIVVTDKKHSITGDKHNYESLSSYYWPDPKNLAGPYINIDGLVNPETLEYDRTKIDKLAERCRTFSIAYYLSGECIYYNALIMQLEAWFASYSTRMYPQMSYSQVIKGKYKNQGQAHGIIDAYAFVDVLESIRLVETIRPLPKGLAKDLKRWFSSFANWLQNSEQGLIEKRQPNNHCPLYYALLTNIALYIGNVDLVNEIKNIYPKEVIYRLIKDDGSQPGELIRTRAYHYSILSIASILDYCLMMKKCEPCFYKKHRERIDKAFEFLIYYIDKKEEFPAKEIGNWNNEVSYLKNEMEIWESLK